MHVSSPFIDHWKKRLRFLDIHYHAAPDLFTRRHGAITAGQLYQQQSGGVILKNHLGSSVAAAHAARELDLPVFPSLVLNPISGGPQWRTIIQALAQHQDLNMGRLLVHLPTFTNTQHISKLARCYSNRYAAHDTITPYSFCDARGKLRKPLIELMHIAKDHPLVLSTGHANRNEVYQLIEVAAQIGLPRLMLNQPASPMTGLTASDLLALGSESWLYIEQTALTYLLGYQSWDDFAATLKKVPNLIYSSDLGQPSQMDIGAWWNTSCEWFAQANIDAKRIDTICLNTPLAMLAV